MPRVSVIIPVHNAEAYLRPCLDSVLGQTLREIEVVCVDDGSTDGSAAVLAGSAAADRRVTVIRQPHHGAAEARNQGLTAAQGDWVHFFDADDLLAPAALEAAVGHGAAAGADVALFGHAAFRQGEPVPALGGEGPWRTVERPAGCGDVFRLAKGWAWDKVWRRDFILSGGFRFQPLPVANDLLFTYSALVAAARLVVTPVPLVAHRYHGGSVETTRDGAPLAPVEAVRALHRQVGLVEGFAEWVPDFLFWHVNRMKSAASRQALLGETRRLGRAWGIDRTAKWRFEELKHLARKAFGRFGA